METISWKQFYRNYLALSDDVSSLRLGQYFIIMFIKDENSDDVLTGLWNQNDRVLAINQCMKVIDKYQWDASALPIFNRGVQIMNEAKFSKGEWVKNGQFTLSIGGEESYLTTQQTGDYWASVEEREANAHLLKTTPKMYGLLQDISKSNCRCDEFYEEISHLLAEARGEAL